MIALLSIGKCEVHTNFNMMNFVVPFLYKSYDNF